VKALKNGYDRRTFYNPISIGMSNEKVVDTELFDPLDIGELFN
jgi:hypothetical protein